MPNEDFTDSPNKKFHQTMSIENPIYHSIDGETNQLYVTSGSKHAQKGP